MHLKCQRDAELIQLIPENSKKEYKKIGNFLFGCNDALISVHVYGKFEFRILSSFKYCLIF